MGMTKLILLSALAVPGIWAQSHAACDLVHQDEANQLLGGEALEIKVGPLGCGYSVRARGIRLTITLVDVGSTVKDFWAGMKAQSAKRGFLVGDEPGMGAAAYAEMIKRSAQSSAGKAGFVVVKGETLLQIFVTDAAEKEDFAGKKETLDKLRPLAKKAAERI
jgi:hypothetical protein